MDRAPRSASPLIASVAELNSNAAGKHARKDRLPRLQPAGFCCHLRVQVQNISAVFILRREVALRPLTRMIVNEILDVEHAILVCHPDSPILSSLVLRNLSSCIRRKASVRKVQIRVVGTVEFRLSKFVSLGLSSLGLRFRSKQIVAG